MSCMQGQYCDIKFRPLFPSFTLKFLKVAFERLRKMSNEKLESHSLKLSKRNCSVLDFLSNFETITFQKIGRRISYYERFLNRLVQS